MPLQRNPRRSSSNPQRRLRVEPLENRALLAAGLMGHAVEFAEKPFFVVNSDEASFTTPRIVKAIAARVATEPIVPQPAAPAESYRVSGEQLRITEPLSSHVKIAIAAVPRVAKATDGSIQLRGEPIHPFRVAAAIESRLEQLRGTSSDNPYVNTIVIDRAVRIRDFQDGGRPHQNTLADRDAVFAESAARAEFASRERAVAVSPLPLSSVDRSASVMDVALLSLSTSELAVTEVHGKSTRSTIPSSVVTRTAFTVDSAESNERGSRVNAPDVNGGMVELDTLEQLDRSPATVDTDQHASEPPWQIRQRTIDNIVENSESKSQADASGRASIIAIERSREGGLIAMNAVPLPAVTATGLVDRGDIRLDPSIGRFRSFQIAAAPGHGIHRRDTSETLVSLATSVENAVEVPESDAAAADFALLDSPVAYAGVAFVSAMILMVESRCQKDVRLKRKAGC
ncbi:hypothetical protein Enr13x_49650 [Stieleria neptunia]|uniref:Uncharacterized protein n=1 Tax=Stieleria neptunia TaxID=2527979 RepID=A0A518HW67_9BACT|nr:hypothetical protein Enr13x_49650 [Stieleria neptunia]